MDAQRARCPARMLGALGVLCDACPSFVSKEARGGENGEVVKESEYVMSAAIDGRIGGGPFCGL